MSHSFTINTFHYKGWRRERGKEKQANVAWSRNSRTSVVSNSFSIDLPITINYHGVTILCKMQHQCDFSDVQAYCSLSATDLRLSLSSSLGLFCFVAAGLSQIIICLMWNQWFITYHHRCDTRAMVLSSIFLNNILNIATLTSVFGKWVVPYI